jgi:hypothetical protein
VIAKLTAAIALAFAVPSAQAGEITAAKKAGVDPNLDVVSAMVSASGTELTFEMSVAGEAGGTKPKATGQMLGSSVYAYVWPTSLDSAAAGFAPGEGILALAVTAHPDFDDTPNYDENGDGKPDNDGNDWHSHWVVLAKDEGCKAGLKVKDVAPGTDVKLPASAPGVPLLLDSPEARPATSGATLTLTVPKPKGAEGMSFDGVASGLRVNTEMKAPLLCVTDVFKIVSGDLSLPGKVAAQ